ncbi:Uncharacterized protein Adt_37998 [Abeliophyllum distichum]|uniref:Uncharacterized protein n=1 Tax=Abeliophyllum distichum TaxID=126358 RepID=A0ABD1Q107_9LAMI
MNPTVANPTAPPTPPPHQLQPPRSSFSCDCHPDEQFIGFFPSCLCERLTTLDQSSFVTPSSSRRPLSSALPPPLNLYSLPPLKLQLPTTTTTTTSLHVPLPHLSRYHYF